jgi:hypothetical protein
MLLLLALVLSCVSIDAADNRDSFTVEVGTYLGDQFKVEVNARFKHRNRTILALEKCLMEKYGKGSLLVIDAVLMCNNTSGVQLKRNESGRLAYGMLVPLEGQRELYKPITNYPNIGDYSLGDFGSKLKRDLVNAGFDPGSDIKISNRTFRYLLDTQG